MSNPYNDAPGPAGEGMPSYENYSTPDGQYGDPNQLLPESNLPGVGRRFAGYIIDSLIIGIIASVLGRLIGVEASAETGSMFAFSLLTVILWLVLRSLSEAQWGGTPGKRWLGMKVVNDSGSNPDFMTALKRNVWYAGSLIPILGWFIQVGLSIWIAVSISNSAEKRSVMDKFANASVVRS